ncbi:MAG: chemotaxis protein CheX [Deltaproteobacteria bacterium]|nr:chemotaxis protein CheX [Deltaproteobacteria bacterium]NNK85932.1 chemotaxis protein CheX [Desulfobacterales bacterium]
MSRLDELDLKAFVTKTLTGVFDKMLSMNLEPIGEGGTGIEGGNQVVGSVGFAGNVLGNVNIHVTAGFARFITAQMLGMETDEIESEEDVFDVIGELCNMVGGDIKSRLCDSGFTCELSIPCVTGGNDLKLESMGWDRCESFGFKCRENIALVQVYMKTEK